MVTEVKFLDYCTSKKFFAIGRKCRNRKLLQRIWRHSNPSFSEALSLTFSTKVSIDNFLFSQKCNGNHFLYVRLIIFTPLWRKISQSDSPLVIIGNMQDIDRTMTTAVNQVFARKQSKERITVALLLSTFMLIMPFYDVKSLFSFQLNVLKN